MNLNISSGFTAIGNALPFTEYLRKANEERERNRDKSNREILKYFNIEITSGFWGKKVKFLQREIPRTEEEINLFLNQSSPLY